VCEPDRIAEVKQAIKTELARLAAEPVSASELATAKRLLAAGYAFANETPADRATTLGFYEAIDSYRTASSYLSWVTHTESAQLAEVARWYAGDPVWVILQPEQSQ
jgi:predicted Zn-dependent peptidase